VDLHLHRVHFLVSVLSLCQHCYIMKSYMKSLLLADGGTIDGKLSTAFGFFKRPIFFRRLLHDRPIRTSTGFPENIWTLLAREFFYRPDAISARALK